MRTRPCLPCTFCLSSCSCLRNLRDFRRKLFTIRSVDSVFIKRLTTPGTNSRMVSIYTTPKKGSLRITRGLRLTSRTTRERGKARGGTKQIRTESLARCGASLV